MQLFPGQMLPHVIERQSALVIVPHEDDEILVAGNLILRLLSERMSVYVAFSTYGDWKIDANVRVHEALSSLEYLVSQVRM